jgi:hypothetical protein
LFLIYINDIALIGDDIKIDLYADDSTLYESGENLSKIEVKHQLNDIEKCCKINNMALNVERSKYMVIGPRLNVKIMIKMYLKINEIVLEHVTDKKNSWVFANIKS